MRIHTNVRGLLARPLTAAALALTAIPFAQASDYEPVVLRDGPLAYYRLNDTTPHRVATATNSGSLGAAGNGTYFPGTQNQVPGAWPAAATRRRVTRRLTGFPAMVGYRRSCPSGRS